MGSGGSAIGLRDRVRHGVGSGRGLSEGGGGSEGVELEAGAVLRENKWNC